MWDAPVFQHILHGQGIQHSGQHTHVVGGGTFHSPGRTGKSTENIAAADDQGHLDAKIQDSTEFLADRGNGIRVYAEMLVAGEGFTAQFDQNALVLEISHGSFLLSRLGAEVPERSHRSGFRHVSRKPWRFQDEIRPCFLTHQPFFFGLSLTMRT